MAESKSKDEDKKEGKNEKTQSRKPDRVERMKLEKEVYSHHTDSTDYMSQFRDDWRDKEAMFMSKLTDDISKNDAKSSVMDPRLATIVIERAARTMAQHQVGHSYAESKDDIGKNKLMDLLLDYYTRHANEQFNLLVKERMWDIYSLLYGSMFALVPWRVDTRRDYIGPEFILKPIRHVLPQPGTIFNDADYVQVIDYVSIDWLKSQNEEVWENVDDVVKEYKGTAGDTKEGDQEEESYMESHYTQQVGGSKAFPKVKLVTEYRRDKWITFSPRSIHRKGSNTHIVRVLDNPYPEGMLPVVKKDAFPLIDRVIGLGEFERGQTLQNAINSLINLYLDGVKYSIFPPLQINPDDESLVPSSIKWGPGEKWFTGRPNQDIQMTQISPQGINQFNSTYGFLVSALTSMSGTSTVTKGDNTESAIGKTPQAIEYMQQQQNARDDWDRFMMEQALTEVYKRWTALIVDKMEKPQIMRIYGSEIRDLKEQFPDVTEVFESGEQGNVKVTKDQFENSSGDPVKFDYRIETGSTLKKDPAAEAQASMDLISTLLDNGGTVLQRVEQEGKTVMFSELLERAFATAGIQGWDKIILDQSEARDKIATNNPEGGEGQVPQDMQQVPPEQAVAPQPQPGQQGFTDPDINSVAQQLFGGVRGIPPNPGEQ